MNLFKRSFFATLCLCELVAANANANTNTIATESGTSISSHGHLYPADLIAVGRLTASDLNAEAVKICGSQENIRVLTDIAISITSSRDLRNERDSSTTVLLMYPFVDTTAKVFCRTEPKKETQQ